MSRASEPDNFNGSFRNGDRDLIDKMLPLMAALPALSLSRSAAYRLIRAGQFPVPVLRVGNRWFVRSSDLAALLTPHN